MADETHQENSEGKQKRLANLTRAGMGRPKGVPNKNTTLLKDAILSAATKAGGEDGLEGYLAKQATDNPAQFMTLLGKVLPLQLNGSGDQGQHIVERIVRRIVDPKDGE